MHDDNDETSAVHRGDDAPAQDACAAVDTARSLRLLEELCEGESGPRDLAAAMGVTLADLARWINASTNAALVEGLLRLANVRAAMVVSRYRTTAAAVLVRIAMHKDNEQKPTDLARKACVDLLSVDLSKTVRAVTGPGTSSDEAGRAAAHPDPTGAPPVADEHMILRALERLGREEDERWAQAVAGAPAADPGLR